jgi:hypothetical protein
LGTEEKRILQVKKTNKFFQLAKDMLEKHFRKWVSELLYLSLFSEGPTAGVVSRFIFPNVAPCSAQEQESYYSEMHKQNINILKFTEFLIGHVSIEDVLKLQTYFHVKDFLTAIRMIGEGGNIWECGALCEELSTYKDYYLCNLAANATNSQMAESAIKGANFCQIPGRSERQASTYASARAGLVPTINQNSIKAKNDNSNRIKGNQYVRSGYFGNRQQTDGSDVVEKEYREAVHGKHKSLEAIKLILKRNRGIEGLPLAKAGRWEEILRDVKSNKSQFKRRRIEIKTEAFFLTSEKNRRPNKLQKKAGQYDITSYANDRVIFSKVYQKNYEEDIKKELEFRGLSTEGEWKAGLIARLMQHENNTYDFYPQCPEACFSGIWERDARKK